MAERCPLCEGNGEVPAELVPQLALVLVRKLAPPSGHVWHVRLATGEWVEAKMLSDSEVALLGLASSDPLSISPP